MWETALFVDVAALLDLHQVPFETVEQLSVAEAFAPVVYAGADDVALLIENCVLLGAVS